MQTRRAAHDHAVALGARLGPSHGPTENLAGNGNLLNGEDAGLNVAEALSSGIAEKSVDHFQPEWLQEMYAAELVDWRGGQNFYNGPHDTFCFICGGTLELFACQTCENCYHAECLSPSLDPEQIPKYYFCPHCVDSNWHVPPSLEEANYLTPNSIPAGVLGLPPISSDPTSELAANAAGIGSISTLSDRQPVQDLSIVDTTPSAEYSHDQPSKQTSDARQAAAKPAAKSRPHPSNPPSNAIPPTRSQPGRPKRSTSPARKKSKYSSFSIEVDKALAVLYSELETAAKHGRSEGNLQDKVQDLEQKLRLQEGQMMLSAREIEAMKIRLGNVQEESDRLRMENARLEAEAKEAREMMERKDSELRDWRLKLRTMMGSELDGS